MKKHIELLAPAGSMEALVAAIQNGANAVFLGGKLFNARHYASNFENEDLMEAISYAHLRNVKVYVTMNILIDYSEIEAAIDYVKFLYDINVDALIVQDLGLASLIRRIFPHMELHGSTQMTVNNLPGSEFLKEMGFSRVTLARETPLSEIKNIKTNTDIELEVFIHGALCMSYSGQCLMSSMIGGRSGNRGMCAQPCRMKYEILDKNGTLLNNWDNVYALSPRDLNTLDEVDNLVENGVESLKIEGRMKRPEYVATIVSTYRKILDNGKSSLNEEDIKDVRQIFNRGFTKGLTFGDFGNDFMSGERPDNKGIRLGKVIRADKYKVYILLEDDLYHGDGMEFQLKNGEYKGIKAPFDAAKGSTLHLEKPGYIEVGSIVYKTSSKALLEKSNASYSEERIKYPINMEIHLRIGDIPKLTVDKGDLRVSSQGDKPVEKSNKVPLTEEKIIEQLGKLGNTTYKLENLEIQLDEGAFLPVSVLNQLRRDAIQSLDGNIKANPEKPLITDSEFNNLKKKYFKFENKIIANPKLSVLVKDINQLEQLDLNKTDRVYIGFYDKIQECVNRIKEHNAEAYIWTDKILYSSDLKSMENAVEKSGADGISVSNIGSLKYFKDRFDIRIHADGGLNAFNPYTVDFLKSAGVSSLTLCPELNLNQIKGISDSVGGNLEATVYGYIPVMITRNCPMSQVKGCKDDNDCKTCNFAEGYGLKDRMDAVFTMYRGDGFTTIYNSVPLMALDSLESIKKSGIDIFRLDFTKEKTNIGRIQSMYYDFLNGNIDINKVKSFMFEYRNETNITNGHFFRGIL